MDTTAVVKKMQKIVTGLREQVRSNDGSSLAAMASGVKNGLDAASAFIKNNEAAQKALGATRRHLTRLEKAVREGDQKMSAKALDFLDKTVADIKEWAESGAKSKQFPAKEDAAASTKARARTQSKTPSRANTKGTRKSGPGTGTGAAVKSANAAAKDPAARKTTTAAKSATTKKAAAPKTGTNAKNAAGQGTTSAKVAAKSGPGAVKKGSSAKRATAPGTGGKSAVAARRGGTTKSDKDR